MSHTVLTAVYGGTDRNSNNPRSIRVVADLVAGGDGVLIVHALESGTRVRIRPGLVPLSAALISGFALGGEVQLTGETADLTSRLASPGHDIELTQTDAAILKQAVARTDVTVVVTTLSGTNEIEPSDFKDTDWAVFIADATEVTGREAPNWRGQPSSSD